MPTMKLFPCQKSSASLFVACVVICGIACVPGAGGTSAASNDYSRRSVAQLIDDLTEIDAPAPGIDSAAMFGGFIADDTPGSFEGGVLPIVPPKVPPQMSELVRRGPLALPELIQHLDDRRPTKLEVGNLESGRSTNRVGVDAFMFTVFNNEYDPRVRHWPINNDFSQNLWKHFQGRYTVKVGDVCYFLVGQIVSRSLIAARYQASGGLVVNSPIEVPALAEKVRNDWGHGDTELLKVSLLADIRAADYPKKDGPDWYLTEIIDSALERLRLYFPDTYSALKDDDLQKRKEFEEREQKKRKPEQPTKPALKSEKAVLPPAFARITRKIAGPSRSINEGPCKV
jgi:hypothetical protein